MSFQVMISQLGSGMMTTIQIFLLTLIFSLPLGLLVAFGRMSKNVVIRTITKIYISIMRGTPLMLQLLVVYFGPYYIFGVNISSSYRAYAVVIAFAINYAAYFAEIYRGGIESMPVGQYEAAKVLGYGKTQTFVKIILPQVIKRILPSVTNEVITLVKDTSLAFSIAYAEMFSQAKALAASQKSMIPFVAAAIFYYVFNYVVAFIMEFFEKKMSYYAGDYDIAVIGAGHAGCEAGLAAARLGMKTLVFSISLEAVANMPCNPHIGGSSKGHLVREIDALGGEMGKNIDKTMIQIKMLNTSKGPAVHSLRAQADRKRYHMEMKHTLEKQENLYLKQGEIVDIKVENGKVTAVETSVGAIYGVKAVIVATGTYLKGKIFMGEFSQESGPDGVSAANKLSDALKRIGVDLVRFKTGTPARINKRSIDFSKMEVQKGDTEIVPFSFEDEVKDLKQVDCYLTYTNEETHKIIRDNLHRSPLYAGKIEGTGPRYCPSIEDKVVRFSDKPRHQAFVEPVGMDTDEMYIQGLSSSLPEEVQIAFYRTIPGLENAEFTRSAYAIEYDCINPSNLKLSLEYKGIDGLFMAGQTNGTSGYEEAACQGLIAGINASQKIKGKEPVILDRSQGYIGVLIDDIVTKGTNEPYRMMTSRAEYRLLLRQDNADLRLTEIGHEVGLISDERYQKFLNKKANIEKEIQRLKNETVKPTEKVNELLKKYGTTELSTGTKMSELLKRTELDYNKLAPIDENRPELTLQEKEEVEIQIKYEGYIKMQEAQVEKFKKLETKLLPEELDYEQIKGLSLEARQKLNKFKPRSIGQASRISGVSPADISVLLIYLQVNKNN